MPARTHTDVCMCIKHIAFSSLSVLGTDEYGEHVHACMYYDLWTNSPKEIKEYPDYTFDQHFGRPVPSYLPREVLRNYIEGIKLLLEPRHEKACFAICEQQRCRSAAWIV